MGEKMMIGMSLQPARPVHHLCSNESIHTISATSFTFLPQFQCSSQACLSNEISSYGILKHLKMGKKWMIGKSLQPARPVRHLCSHESIHTISAPSFTFLPQFQCSSQACLSNEISSMYGMLVLNETLISGLPEQHKPEVTKERITYSRDFLLKLSEVSLAQKKPEFLPNHPVVLEKPKNCLLPTSSNGRSF